MSYKWDESIDIEFIGGEVRLIKSSIAYKYDQYGEIDLESEYLEYYYDDSIYLKLRDVINF